MKGQGDLGLLALLGLESSLGPRLLMVIAGTSCPLYLEYARVFRKGEEVISHSLKLSRLAYAEGVLFWKRSLKQKENIAYDPKAETSSISHLGDTSCSGAAAKWLRVLLDLGMVAKCAVGYKAS